MRAQAGDRRMYENILLPTDGSDGARRGVEHGLDIAEKYGAKVHVLFVVDERVHGDTPALSSEELALEKWEQEGEEVVAEIVEQARQLDLETANQSLRGVPHEVILEYTEDNDIDLIVMGLHGQSEVQRPHIGSTTDRVIRGSNVPVLPV